MKTERHFVPEMTIEQFAEQHGLTMEIHERGAEFVKMAHIGPNGRFYAQFKGVEVTDGHVLSGEFGDGATPEIAIFDYARNISEKRLVIDAGQPSRKEIQAPRFV